MNRSVLFSAALIPLTFSGAAVAADATTPKGLTLINVERELEFSQPESLWIRPGDADGRTLFFSEGDAPGVSNCTAACAKEWIPVAAPAGAKPSGDWSIIKRESGAQQWAYNARPVYTWVKEERPGDVATGVAVDAVFNSKLAQKVIAFSDLRPPQGWNVARFEPSIKTKAPDGIDARVNVYAEGVTLTDFDGLTLYAFDGDARKDGLQCSSAGCANQWMPVPAPSLAAHVGDFSIALRADGSRQWAFKKKPLYRFKADLLPGDTKGRGVDKKFAVALLTETFRPEGVTITPLNGYGSMLTIGGKALYTGVAYEARWGGRNLRDGYRNMYYKGKQMGGQTCVSAACLALWQPFRPGADAQSNGYWEVITRDDGTRQWAYKGYALYTYTGDKAPGDFNGNDTYDSFISDGVDEKFQQAAWLVEMNGRAGVYWHIAKP